MTKFKFPDGFECYAESKSEALKRHLENNSTIQFCSDVIDSVGLIKESINNSLKALDIVNKDSFPKKVVIELIQEIKQCVEKQNLDHKAEELSEELCQ